MESLDSLQSYSSIISYLQNKKRTLHLLLGNGFSIAYDPSIFSYNALSDYVQDKQNEELTKLFDCVKTTNFEIVLRELRIAYKLCKTFGAENYVLNKIVSSGKLLKKHLIEAIENLHPEHVFTISDEQCSKCYEFLQTYIDNEGKIFYTNYDLLLYWVLMRSSSASMDGFGRAEPQDGEDPNETKLIWGKYKNQQSVFYLHGALPLFDDGIDVVKEEYSYGTFLIDKIRKNIAQEKYPIFVTAGSSEEKLQHIMHNKYLEHCYEQLCSIKGSLITFGFQFGSYDNHVIDAINKAAYNGALKDADKLWSVYIGVYSESDLNYINSIKDNFKCKVKLFDARTINPWYS